MYKWITIITMGIVASMPSSVEASTVPIADGAVIVEDLVDHFDGQRLLDRNEDDRHYVEYLFDGNALRRYEKEIVLWLNGEAVPYGFEYVGTIRVPVPGRQVTLARGFQLPAEFFEHYLGYIIEDNTLRVDEATTEEPTQPTPEPAKPTEADVDSSDNIDKQGEETDSTNEEAPSLAEPTEEQDYSQDNSDSDNDQADGPEPSDDEPTQEPAEDTEKPIHKESEDESEKEAPAPSEKEGKDKAEETKPVEPEPVKVGRLSITLDRADMGFYHTIDKPSSHTVAGESFTVYFKDERTVVIEHHASQEQLTMQTHKGMTQSFTFHKASGDYVVLDIEIEDSRHAGLTEQRVRERIGAIHPDIVVEVEAQDIHLYFKHIEFNLREQLFDKTEQSLVSLGVQRFRFNKESGRWDIWFNLFDSDWG